MRPGITRQELVEHLLWWMYEHQCCQHETLYSALYLEAQHAGWALPDTE